MGNTIKRNFLQFLFGILVGATLVKIAIWVKYKDLGVNVLNFLNTNLGSAVLSATLFAFITNVLFQRYLDRQTTLRRFLSVKNRLLWEVDVEWRGNQETIQQLEKYFMLFKAKNIVALPRALTVLENGVLESLLQPVNFPYINPEVTSSLFSLNNKILRFNKHYEELFLDILRDNISNLFGERILILETELEKIQNHMAELVELNKEGLLTYDNVTFSARLKYRKFRIYTWFQTTILKKKLG